MVNWNEGSNHDPVNAQSVQYGAEQQADRAIRPWDEARFLLGRAWAGVRWPFATARRLVRRGNADEG